MNWTAEREGALRSLIEKGSSASQVAKEFLRVYRVAISRNAVIGKVHRLGLCFAKTLATQMTPAIPRPPMIVAAAPAILRPPAVVATAATGVTLENMDFERDCRYPLSDDPRQRPFYYCGEDRCLPGHSRHVYCDRHHKISRSSPSPR